MTEQDRFERDGYCVLRSVCEKAAADFGAAFDAALPEMAAEVPVSVDEYLRLVSAWDLVGSRWAEAVARVAAAIRPRLKRLMDPEDAPMGAELFIKTPAAPAPTHAHQDIGYLWQAGRPRYDVTTWLALDDCDEASGSLTVLPGSHREPIQPQQDFLAHSFVNRAASADWARLARPIAAHRGDVVVFDVGTWHASTQLVTRARRRALVLRWRTHHARTPYPVPRPAASSAEFGMLTSGALLMRAATPLFPVLASMQDKRSLSPSLDTMLAASDVDRVTLPTQVWSALSDLQRALWAHHKHHARPSPRNVWLPIRDLVIPALERAAKGTLEGGKP